MGDITTVAGAGVGDGDQATSASLHYPFSVFVDPSGNIYIADRIHNLIRKVDTSGIITTVAGNGAYGFSGDGGPATSASLYRPSGVSVDSSGNIYIADKYNHRIRKVDTSGVISTVAGGGSSLGDGGPATSASLGYPTGVSVDVSGNIYITAHNRIRKVDTSGIITTVAGNGDYGFSGDGGPATSASLNNPYGVFVDPSGNIYIADAWNNRIRKVDTQGIITTVAGNGIEGFSGDNGPATSASLDWPAGVYVDSSGNIYIADNRNHRIRRVDTAGVITTVAGDGDWGFSGDNGPATSASLNWPRGVSVDSSGNIYIADTYHHRIRRVDTDGIITTVAGRGTGGFSGDGGPAASAGLYLPYGVSVDASGNIYIADTFNNRIRKVDTDGIITTVAGNGTEGFSGDGGPATSAALDFPAAVSVDASGNIFIADRGNHRIRKIDTNGVIATVAGNGTGGFSGDGGPATSAGLNGLYDIHVDASGNIFIADRGNLRIRKVDTQGVITTVAGNGDWGFSGDGGPATSASLASPSGVSVDSSGNIYIADESNNRIRKVDTNGVITTVAGNGDYGFSGDCGPATSASLNEPSGVYVDSSGNIYVADTDNHRIRKVDTNGVITTVAGNGTRGFSGDNGPATSASIGKPEGVYVDSSGNIYIADTYNDRIRMVEADTSGIATTATVSTDEYSYTTGDTHTVCVSLENTGTETVVDVYLALMLPDGSLLFVEYDIDNALYFTHPGTADPATWTPAVTDFTLEEGYYLSGFVPGQYVFTGAEPEGDYMWYIGLTTPGTTDFIGNVRSKGFTFTK